MKFESINDLFFAELMYTACTIWNKKL